ncbi:Ribosome production factor 2 like [Apostasia shenzhenica]|uniref:indole-3-glycerol-phosphate synthase n=1 Tax=Apostasia shenzhenica TaxID=1088818 RepID=A0A2I0A0S0_9ASPA|nr:Ribosome production factor 2 like [Apostasia shenzhenica]
MLKIKTPKTHKAKRELEKRAPKLVENAKKTLILNGTKTSNVLNAVLAQIYHLRKGLAVKFSKKNENIRPFESGGETSLEFFSLKTDCSLFVFGSHSKKRPNNLVLGRMYDHHVYDLVEVGVENFKPIESFKYDKMIAPRQGSKPFFAFIGEGFENSEELKHLKDVLLDHFRGEVVENLNLTGIDRVYVCTAISSNTIFFTHCAIRLRKSGTSIPRIELVEVGPSMDLVVRRHRLPNDSVKKEAMRTALTQPKKIKNVTRDEVKGKLGKIYIPDQQVGALALSNNVKGLKRERREAKMSKDNKDAMTKKRKTEPQIETFCCSREYDLLSYPRMEGILIGVSAMVMVKPCNNLSSMNFTWRNSIGGMRRFGPLRCNKPGEDSTDGLVKITYSPDYIANSIEVSEWESGVPLDRILENQGIRIRRRPPSGPSAHSVGPFEFRLENEGNSPRNILEKIIWNKDVELKERKPLSMLIKDLERAPPVRDFVGALKASYQKIGMPALIAEVKKASPSRGVLREKFDPVEIASTYEKNGATCLSILTDEKYFQGSFENLELVRRAGVKCPLLCKEFIIDAWQIYYARSKGADAILLIAAVLPDLDIKYMTKICRKLGIAALVEVHNEREMDRVLDIDGIQLIGINNRDLETFEVDILNTKNLLEGERGQLIHQKGITVVGESGLFTPKDVAFVHDAGVKAVLVGESLIKKEDPGKAIAELFGKDISTYMSFDEHFNISGNV